MRTNKTGTDSSMGSNTKGNGTSATTQDQEKTNEAGLDLAQHAKEDVQNMADAFTSEGQGKYGKAKFYAAKSLKIIEKQIEQNPLKSVAIALGTGVLISFLLRKS